jgi:hypothetical protein
MSLFRFECSPGWSLSSGSGCGAASGALLVSQWTFWSAGHLPQNYIGCLRSSVLGS